MSISCKFQLTRSSNIFYCGERIEGSVYLRPLKARQIEEICVQFCGQTQVAWWDLDKAADVSNNIAHNDYSTQEVWQKTQFSNRQKHVCDQLKLANRQWLQPYVEYEYQFSFLVPQQVPATSRCPLGECEYMLQLVLQHTKKANKEFHQKVTVKRKLDLSQCPTNKEPCTVTQQTEFGQLLLSTPSTGFTPGQRIPYLLRFQAAQLNCKIIMQLNCYIRCRSSAPDDKEKLIKQIVHLRKHSGLGSTISHLTMPLDSHISMPTEGWGNELILNFAYTLEASVIDGSKNARLSVVIPLTIGTTPCIKTSDDEIDDKSASMCYDNYGSPHSAHMGNALDMAATNSGGNEIHQVYDSMGLLHLKPRATHLRRSLRYCYKKISKII